MAISCARTRSKSCSPMRRRSETIPEIGPKLFSYFDPDRKIDVVGVHTVADSIDARLRAIGIDGIAAASDTEVRAVAGGMGWTGSARANWVYQSRAERTPRPAIG